MSSNIFHEMSRLIFFFAFSHWPFDTEQSYFWSNNIRNEKNLKWSERICVRRKMIYKNVQSQKMLKANQNLEWRLKKVFRLFQNSYQYTICSPFPLDILVTQKLKLFTFLLPNLFAAQGLIQLRKTSKGVSSSSILDFKLQIRERLT